MKTKEMTTEEKYESLIGMIEGCMPDDDDIVHTEQLLESLLIDLTAKYPIFSLIVSGVTFHRYPQCKCIEQITGGTENSD